MLKFFTLTVIVLSAAFTWALDITAEYLLIKPSGNCPVQEQTLVLLNKHLTQIFGKPVTVIKEEDWNQKDPAIVVGASTYADKLGIRPDRLADQQIVLKVHGSNVIVSGGKQGVYYAALDLLEMAGCRVLAYNCKIVPQLKSFAISDELNIFRTPTFCSRRMYIGRHNKELYNWNKINDEVSGLMELKMIGPAHSFDMLSRDFPEDKPELFALNAQGQRVRGPRSQLCLSNPETQKKIKEKVRRWIQSEASKPDSGKFYRVTPNDTGWGCTCENCAEIIQKYGAPSGLLIEFINGIAAEFPKQNFITFAYRFNRQAPKEGSIKLRDNVYLEVALQSIEWGDGEFRSILRPWISDCNETARKQFIEWTKFTRNLFVWDYSKLYQQEQCLPYTAVPAIIANMDFYVKNGVKGYFLENEMGSWRGGALKVHAFQELEYYLAAKLMDNPSQDVQKLIDEYFVLYYGPAAVVMKHYFDLIVDGMQKNPIPENKHFSEWKFLNADFFRQGYAYLDEALKIAGNNETLQSHILFEAVALDSALLALWPQFTAANVKFDFDRNTVESRLERASESVVKRYFPNSADGEKQRMQVLRNINSLVVPPEGVSLDQAKLLTAANAPLRNDKDAFRGKSRQLDDRRVKHDKFPEFGVYDPKAKKYCTRLIVKKLPQDEKYHWYYMGRCSLSSGQSYVYCHWTWKMVFKIAPVFTADLRDKPLDIYVSAKFQGPAYVKDSNLSNLFAVEHILLVPADEKMPLKGLVK